MITYKGRNLEINEKLRRFYVFQTGYDLSKADVQQAITNKAKEYHIDVRDYWNTSTDGEIAESINEFMTDKITVYRQEFGWDISKAEKLSESIEKRVDEYIDKDGFWK